MALLLLIYIFVLCIHTNLSIPSEINLSSTNDSTLFSLNSTTTNNSSSSYSFSSSSPVVPPVQLAFGIMIYQKPGKTIQQFRERSFTHRARRRADHVHPLGVRREGRGQREVPLGHEPGRVRLGRGLRQRHLPAADIPVRAPHPEHAQPLRHARDSPLSAERHGYGHPPGHVEGHPHARSDDLHDARRRRQE